MVAVVVLYIDRRFRGAFESICKCLQITFWTSARGNHKVNRVEKYHRLLNKTQDISGHDCGSHDSFIQNTKTYQYLWNISPINDTDVMCRVAAVGIEFRFTLDMELLLTPTLNPDNNQAFLKYLQDVYTNSQLSMPTLKIIIEEGRTAHCEICNKGKHQQIFKVGDVVKAHIQVQSKAETG